MWKKQIYQGGCFLMLSVGAIASAQAQSGSVSACREIQWQPYQVYSIRSSLHQRTHVILPEPIQGSPVPGNPQLWDIDGENIHLFIKPKNLANKEGATTTVTAISTTNTSYDFVVHRIKNNPDICVRIVRDTSFVRGSRQGWKTQVERDNARMSARIAGLQASMNKQEAMLGSRVSDSVHKYKTTIYTRYSWSGKGGFLGENTVTDVWDDGRFTYVRLKSSNKGILQITAEIDGKEEMVDYKFDGHTNLYTISGLFPRFILRYDKASVVIKREDNKSF